MYGRVCWDYILEESVVNHDCLPPDQEDLGEIKIVRITGLSYRTSLQFE
jgi:hypothetical protein